ncbi:hypothetical protein AW736_15180 [Termitidicoccus mucosus]|uniref:Uncharacterized protein n=1 Tax=Termitidicoccus mucosus TaxID=1184151 RepID=A0A178IH38_9BACT|nr:hypothetical protein AW736_15180 [Opitutaceae bacterium TSB47]
MIAFLASLFTLPEWAATTASAAITDGSSLGVPLILAQVPSQVKTGFQYGLGLLFMIGFPEVKAKVEERIKNVPAENRQRAFVRVAKDEAMRQTMRQGQGQPPPSQGIGV